ncbi:MAG: hypothetical protein AAF288_11980 [Planctomycetota bacterium]
MVLKQAARCGVGLAWFGAAWLHTPAFGDGGPGMMIESRLSPFDAQLRGGVSVEATESDNTGQDVDLRFYSAEGWFDLTSLGSGEAGATVGAPATGPGSIPGAGAPGAGGFGSPRLLFGFQVLQLEIDALDPAIPERLSDQRIGFGYELGVVDLGETLGPWVVGFTGGVGNASDTSYSGSDAWYGHGSIYGVRRIDERSSVTVLVTYDGNRSFLPDVPLPGVVYTQRVDAEFAWSVGFPFVGARWDPEGPFKVAARWTPLADVRIDAEYELAEHWSLFGGLTRDEMQAWIDGENNRRVFFQASVLEAGVAWRPDPRVEVRASAGYAFAQSFEEGFAILDTDTLADLDDAPFGRVSVTVRY